ncbi:MAG: carbamate kinase [Thermoproteus sp. AZ2]|uniref:Carbamate kinase n=1 Tax=Thermoproteus sp. AZ2 TaxID=1609232 RepID=A0ACC6UZY9_9CREN|nr:MAG: carbamate kinase [Thermoproteus sp. AZ2]
MLVVIALGGNAFLRPGAEPSQEEHLRNIKAAARVIAEIAREGHSVVVTHGNGPQVGILDELQAIANRRYFSLDAIGAATQGLLGYLIAQSIDEELRDSGRAIAVVTRSLVRLEDPAFSNPTKFVGAAYPKEVAEALAAKYGWAIRLDKARGWRRVVPSPEPVGVVEARAIRALLQEGFIVVAVGGGGVPVADGRGVEAVIDKDLASQVLANELGANALVILTDVDGVYLDYGTERQRGLGRVSVDELERYYREGQFPAGSMGPKVLAAIRFIRGGGEWAAIGRLEEGYEVFKQRRGTIILP